MMFSQFHVTLNMFNRIRAVFNPERYHGWGIKRKYFEGWYYKIISANSEHSYAIIPGIAMDEKGQKQAFIQVLDGKKHTAQYHKFEFSDFNANPNKFEVNIGQSHFTNNFVKLNLPEIKGELKFSNQFPWPKTLLSPGIMGPYTFAPFMECYHGILSMSHSIEGKLHVSNIDVDFSNGKGYTEKDWGHSFPSAYFWLQSNHFKNPEIAFKASVAKIPWLKKSFVGYITGLVFNNELIRFTTYNGTKLLKSIADKNQIQLVFENKLYRLKVDAKRNKATELASPIGGLMDGKISESMTSEIELQLFDSKSNKLLLHDIGQNAGLEVAGKIEDIFFS